ncbi:unnamed protein product [Pleuronectes platessa]|uniref:Uncharacterized protein n=1 Tax=Pleuronectes platessa TaxID=8262 RepID=A0A9N7VTW8_PLEPL|nr:unnamed protein product [Pleuronectes platessa]
MQDIQPAVWCMEVTSRHRTAGRSVPPLSEIQFVWRRFGLKVQIVSLGLVPTSSAFRAELTHYMPAFVSMAGASNPAVRIRPDKMFGQALHLPSGLTPPRRGAAPRPIRSSDSSLSSSTFTSAPSPPSLIDCHLLVPPDNDAIDFALRGQAMTSKAFVPSSRLKIPFRAQAWIRLSGDVEETWRRRGGDVEETWRRRGGDVEETWRRRGGDTSSLGSFFLGANLVSGGGLFLGGKRGPLLYFGFLVARLLSPRSPITQFELTLPVQGEPRPGATHCYNSSNTMK